jgi:hypothetical protein
MMSLGMSIKKENIVNATNSHAVDVENLSTSGADQLDYKYNSSCDDADDDDYIETDETKAMKDRKSNVHDNRDFPSWY